MGYDHSQLPGILQSPASTEDFVPGRLFLDLGHYPRIMLLLGKRKLSLQIQQVPKADLPNPGVSSVESRQRLGTHPAHPGPAPSRLHCPSRARGQHRHIGSTRACPEHLRLSSMDFPKQTFMNLLPSHTVIRSFLIMRFVCVFPALPFTCAQLQGVG